MITPAQYLKQEFTAGRSGSIAIRETFKGQFDLCDADWNLLKCNSFTSRGAAESFRSKAVDRALKFINTEVR